MGSLSSFFRYEQLKPNCLFLLAIHIFSLRGLFPNVFARVRWHSTLRAFGFSYASREKNSCKQLLVSLREPPSSAKDDYIKFELVKRVSKLVLELACVFSYVTAAFGRAYCVIIIVPYYSREIRRSDVK